MFCILYKWLISRSMDSRRALPARVSQHVEHCPACRAYRDDCLALADELVNEARDIRATVSDDLHARILLRCGIGGGASPVVAPAPAMPMPHSRNGRLKLGLAVAAAAAAAIILGVAVLQFTPETSHTPKKIVIKSVPAFPEVYSQPSSLAVASAQRINNAIDRSIDREFDGLRNTGLAAADFVIARMPIPINMPE